MLLLLLWDSPSMPFRVTEMLPVELLVEIVLLPLVEVLLVVMELFPTEAYVDAEVNWMLQVAPCGELASPLAVAGERLSPLSGPVVFPQAVEMAVRAVLAEEEAVVVSVIVGAVTVSTGPGLGAAMGVGVLDPDRPSPPPAAAAAPAALW